MKVIVITGSHGVGKTTLCRELHSSLFGEVEATLIPEMARILIAKGIPMNDQVSEFAIVTYVVEYLKLRRLAKGSLVISDRSVFDLYAYIRTRRPSEVRQEFVQLAEEVTRAEVLSGNLYVYVPIEFPMVVDDVRPEATAYQRLIDSAIVELLKSLNATVLTVSGSLNERVEQVRNAIGL